MLYYTVRMLESIEGRQGSVSSWLHKVRTRLDLSQHDLARILGVHWVTVSRWENGHNEPKLSQLSRLALFFLKEALDMTPELGVKTVLGYIFSHNEGSIRLFRSFGFEEWGRLTDIATMDGKEYSVSIVGRRVNP